MTACEERVVVDRRMPAANITGTLAEVFPDWQGSQERWLFIAPHDDDIVCGAGLTFAAACETGIATWAAVVTTGEVGYCHTEHRQTIAATRAAECRESFRMMGLPPERLVTGAFPDGVLRNFAGFRLTNDTRDPHAICGTTGLQSFFTWLLRKVTPTRLFIPSITDIHPDHRCVNEEIVISIFHAFGGIWPELGEKLKLLPMLYEYATYSDFLTPPTIRLRTSLELLERKLGAIAAYRSQEQIDLVVDLQRRAGAKEFLREVRFDLFQPEECDKLFPQ